MERLLVHHHLAKNAGSSLGRVIRANYRPPELYENYQLTPWIDGREWWRDWYESLEQERRAALRCVGSHTAQLLLPIVRDRQVTAFTVLRDPVERVHSLYNHALWQQRRRRAAGEPLHRELLANAVLERDWSLKDIFLELGDSEPADVPLVFRIFFNGQTRELLANAGLARAMPLTTGAGLDRPRSHVLEILSERYVVGTQDRFSQSVRLFAESFGWRQTFLPRANVATRGRGGVEIDAETRALARAYNPLDAEVHERYSRRLSSLRPISAVSQARGRARRRLVRTAGRVRRKLGAGWPVEG